MALALAGVNNINNKCNTVNSNLCVKNNSRIK